MRMGNGQVLLARADLDEQGLRVPLALVLTPGKAGAGGQSQNKKSKTKTR